MVELGQFTGPLDLLLSLIRDEQVDIYDIPIARIAEQFLGRISTLALDEAADYLEMAARLLRIKAQMLLPRSDGTDAWEDPRAELVRRLLEYQQMREVVDLLEHRGEERRHQFARQYIPVSADVTPAGAPLSLVLADLLAAIDRIMRTSREPVLHEVVPRVLDIAGAMARVRAVIRVRARCGWLDLLGNDAEPWQILSMLMALLEMARSGELHIIQRRPFASLEIRRDAISEAA